MSALENKIPPPLVALFLAIDMWAVSLYLPAIEMDLAARMVLFVAALVAGVFFCLAGVVSFRIAKTTVNPLQPNTATSLVSSGIYRISRNPMYVGFALLLVAWTVYLSSLWAGIGVLVFILFINRFQIVPEEKHLPKYSALNS